MSRRAAVFVVCALTLMSCSRSATNVVLASLNRSEKIDLLCADIEQLTGNSYELRANGLFPLALCDEDTNFASGVQAQALGEVTQVESGTLAVVNFSNGAIFDTNVTVPGVTALRVGEQPTAVQVSSVDSRYTYVSSFSPKTVQAISTREVITGSPALDEDMDGEPDEPVLPPQQLRFDAGPTDLALYELATFEPILENGEVTGATTEVSYRYLYAALPDLGQVAQIQVDIDSETGRQTLIGVTLLDLPFYDCSSVTPVLPPPSDVDIYNRICPEDFDNRGEGRFVKNVSTTQPCTDGTGTGPSPVALAIDRGDPNVDFDDVLLVADGNQPVIHRFSVSENGANLFPVPIVTLAPTDDVAVTPQVPVSSDPDDRAAVQRYLYAVSAGDGSVLAVDYTAASPTFGAVLPVIAGVSSRANEENVESRNRVRSGFSNARAIEVISPFYELETNPNTGALQVAEGNPETDICDPNDPDAFALAQNASNMRGVFLAVSLSNGTLFFLDIYDLNAPCRGGEGNLACTLAETGPDQFASIRRHRRRFNFTPTTFIAIDGTPSLQFNANPGAIDEMTGLPLNSDGPSLERILCPASFINVYGLPVSRTEGFICASSQVWSSFTQRWDALWQGLIPESEGGLGLFSDESYDLEPGNWFLAGDVPFCRVGVLGRQGGTPSNDGLSINQLQAYRGDRLVITGDLPPARANDPDCDDFVDLLEDVDDRQVWFPIIRAFNDQLEIGPAPSGANYTLDQVRTCFDQFTAYQIHTRSVYTVVGTTSGFINRVVPDEITGECVLDDSRPVVEDDVDTFLTGRAFPGSQYINPLVSFQISNFGPTIVPTDSTVALLNFNILNQFGVELLDTGGTSSGSLPGSMLFVPEVDELLFVDYDAGVRRIVFSPLNIIQTFD